MPGFLRDSGFGRMAMQQDKAVANLLGTSGFRIRCWVRYNGGIPGVKWGKEKWLRKFF